MQNTLQEGKIVLFSEQPVADALADLAAIAGHLCDCEHHDYGLMLLHRMLRDSLTHLACRLSRAAQGFPQTE
jgi:hypothetical protein